MVRVVAAAIQDGNRFLACRRSVERGGKWEFPGGKVEVGESDIDALIREVAEELAVAIDVGEQIAEVEVGSIRLVTYLATLAGRDPERSSDHDALRWLVVSDLPSLDWADADRAAVEHLVAHAQTG